MNKRVILDAIFYIMVISLAIFLIMQLDIQLEPNKNSQKTWSNFVERITPGKDQSEKEVSKGLNEVSVSGRELGAVVSKSVCSTYECKAKNAELNNDKVHNKRDGTK